MQRGGFERECNKPGRGCKEKGEEKPFYRDTRHVSCLLRPFFLNSAAHAFPRPYTNISYPRFHHHHRRPRLFYPTFQSVFLTGPPSARRKNHFSSWQINCQINHDELIFTRSKLRNEKIWRVKSRPRPRLSTVAHSIFICSRNPRAYNSVQFDLS